MNFALIMFSLLVVTGAVTLLDHYVFSKRRAAGAAEIAINVLGGTVAAPEAEPELVVTQ